MAAREAAIQCSRVGGRKRIIGSRTLAYWVAGSEAGHGDVRDLKPLNSKRV